MRIPQYEDSIQFYADLYIEGKRAGIAKDNGMGGGVEYQATSPEGHALIEKAETYFKSLPHQNIAGKGAAPVMCEQQLGDRLL